MYWRAITGSKVNSATILSVCIGGDATRSRNSEILLTFSGHAELGIYRTYSTTKSENPRSASTTSSALEIDKYVVAIMSSACGK
jgi:hypothetical protein